jgi:hypothetical protein
VPAISVPEIDTKRIYGSLGTSGSTTTWTFEITDPAVIPDHYKMIDAKKIGRDVKAAKGKITIPGVKVIEVKGLRVTPKAQWGQPR